MAEKKTHADKPWLKSYRLGPFKLRETQEPYPKIPLHKFLDDAAANFPENIAYVYLGGKMSYKDLKLHVDKLATALADLGVKKGDKVATILPTSPQFIICDHAIHKLGAVHVPCSILHKEPDLLYEIGESGAETIICLDRRLSRVNRIKDKTKLKTMIITSFEDYSSKEPEIGEVPGAYQLRSLIAKYDPDPPEVEINPMEDLAELPFTGGTTGVPKGVMLTHYNVAANVFQLTHWMLQPLAAGIKGKASVLICVPLFHQYGHFLAHSAISWALRMLLVLDPRDADAIAQFIREYRPFMVCGVPTHFMRLLSKDIEKYPIFCYSAAAALPPEVAEKFEKKIGVPLGEGYGLTETGPATHVNLSAFSKITGFMAAVKKGSIGIPIPDTEAKIVNPETGEEVPSGGEGELYLRGPQLMKGYWPTPGKGLVDGWLPTGDIAKIDEDGYFYVVDRVKDMINVSGYKVYSRIVDDVLFEHPAVEVAGVIGIPDPERPGSERIKAFVKLKEEHEGKVTAEDIIKHCEEKLPPYAVPKFVEFRGDLPLTVTEKIFKRELREEEIAKMRGGEDPSRNLSPSPQKHK